jgi:hypothetical protein
MRIKHLLKYRFTLLFLLGCLLLLLPFKEGFSTLKAIGPYQYLAPISPNPTVLDAKTEAQFTAAYNKVNADISKMVPIKDATISQFKKNATLVEFKYFIKYNKWPYGSYITTYLENNDISNLPGFKDLLSPVVLTKEVMQRIYSSRMCYAIVLNIKEMNKTPHILTNDIFLGLKPPPDTLVPSESSVPTVEPSAPTSSLSAENYQKLVSICTEVK